MSRQKSLIAGVTIIYLLFLGCVVSAFLADYFATRSKSSLYAGNLGVASVYVRRAVKLNKSEPAYHRLKATNLIASTVVETLDPSERELVLELALAELRIAYNLQKDNIVNIKSLIPLYYYLSVDEVAAESSGLNEAYRTEAVSFLDEVFDSSPTDSSLYLTIGKYYRLLGETEKAKVAIRRAFALKEDSLEIITEAEILGIERPASSLTN